MELPLIRPLMEALSPALEYLFDRYPILAQLAERDDLLPLVFTVSALLLLLMTVFTPRTKLGLPIVLEHLRALMASKAALHSKQPGYLERRL